MHFFGDKAASFFFKENSIRYRHEIIELVIGEWSVIDCSLLNDMRVEYFKRLLVITVYIVIINS